MQIKTVRVKDEGFPDGVLINASDYDAAVHVLYDAPQEPPADSTVNLSRMTEPDLVALARERGLTVTDADTRATLIDALGG